MKTLLKIGARALAMITPLALLGLGCGEEAATRADAWRTDDEFVRAVNRGVHSMNRYEYADAARAFGEALDLAPDSLEARLGLALATFNNPAAEGGPRQAAEFLDQILERDPGHLQAAYFRGIVDLTAGEAQGAMRLFEQVVEAEPHDAHVWYALARAKKQAGLPHEEELRRAIAENSSLSSAYYELFLLLQRKGPEHAQEAERMLEAFTALKEHPLATPMDPGQYGRTGPLGIVRPLAIVPQALAGEASLSFGEGRRLYTAPQGWSAVPPQSAEITPSALAAGDVDSDGDLDLVTVLYDSAGATQIVVLRNDGLAGVTDVTEAAGLGGISAAVSLALGDYDNDGWVDLFVARRGANRLFRGGEGLRFADVTTSAGVGGPGDAVSCAAVFLDADHDADLDLYVCNLAGADGGAAANQLLRNNSDATFSDVADSEGLACLSQRSVALAPIDIDDDRDTDLVVFHEDAPISFFRNDLIEGFSSFDPIGAPVDGGRGGIAQDFDGDGRPDLLVFATGEQPMRLFLGSGVGPMQRSVQFEQAAASLPPTIAGPSPRIADIDLDGDLDVALLHGGSRWLVNDGRGLFAPRLATPPSLPAGPAARLELMDFNADGVVDLLASPDSGTREITLSAGRLDTPARWLGLGLTGQHSQAYSTRSPASGYGTKVEVRAGLHGQTLVLTGLHGGTSQSLRPLIFGLGGAAEADYVHLRWPDGITQSETGLEANSYHVLAETQRRPTSCPMLFAWDGERFSFVGDFAGVGGLGYNGGSGTPAPPQVKELVRIRSDQLSEQDGLLQLRVCEPMEEAAYLDRLELIAIDHPAGREVLPDERLAFAGPAATQELLQVARLFFPVRAEGPSGPVEPARLVQLDRSYAYSPPRDRRFFGYCHPHALVVEFGPELSQLEPGRKTYLFLAGSLEYPYSQTNVAASQAGLEWSPPRLELLDDQGRWVTLVEDTGAPGGMARTIAVELPDELPAGAVALRLVTNLEIYYDRIFIAQDLGPEGLEIRSTPVRRAQLRRLGFPQEFSPDGHNPRIYSYDIIEASFGFRRLPGAYTRYGDVRELLEEFDDRFVVMATGDEVVVDFDATRLPPLDPGLERTYVLVSHAYCKDMDLHSVGPGTVEPLPFAAMSSYPYPDEERYPWDAEARAWHEQYNTRVIR